MKPYWANYPITYRTQEMQKIASWLAAGESGTVVGLPGTGRATLLNYLCHCPGVLPAYLPQTTPKIIPIPVDLNNLLNDNLSTFYRLVLRAFHEVNERFPAGLAQAIVTEYYKHEAASDPFLPQSGLRVLLRQCQIACIRVVLVLDRFDHFCQIATPEMTRTLRALRDSFKGTLCYLAGTHQEIIYLSEWPSLEPVHHLLDSHVCWVGPLNEADAAQMVTRHLPQGTYHLPDIALTRLLALTGGYPAFVRVACNWWIEAGDEPLENWGDALAERQDMGHRLEALWAGLSQEEQSVLIALQKHRSGQLLGATQTEVLHKLVEKGVCHITSDGWQIRGELVQAYVAKATGLSRGKIWLYDQTGELFQGTSLLRDLSPQEYAVLSYLIQHPYRRHTYTKLIEATWPEAINKEGVSTEALYQIIRGIRKKIEPDTQNPCYIINWRGQQEGGYQLFPEGRPVTKI